MLVIHPTSTCDVCLDGYTGDSDLIPHAIGCGHVFCSTCLQSLLHKWCPLCRTPFNADEILRLHMDRSARQTPNVSPQSSMTMLSVDGSLEADPKLIEEAKIVDDSASRAIDLQNRITEIANGGLFRIGFPESGVPDLLDETKRFLSNGRDEMYLTLRAVFCLLEYSNELQSQCSNLERENEVLRGQRIDASQAALDAERKCAAIQKDRMKDREASRNLEINLRDQHKAERLELQQKIDLLKKDCKKLEDELVSLRRTTEAPPTRPPSSNRSVFSEGIRRRESSEDEEERTRIGFEDNSLMLSFAPSRRERLPASIGFSTAPTAPLAANSSDTSSNFIGPRPYKSCDKSQLQTDFNISEGNNVDGSSRPCNAVTSYASASAQTSARPTALTYPFPSPNSMSQRPEQSPGSSPTRYPWSDYFSSRQADVGTSSSNPEVSRLNALLDTPQPHPLPVTPQSNAGIAFSYRRPRSRTQSRDASPTRSINQVSYSSRSAQAIPPVPALPTMRPLTTTVNLSSSANYPSSNASATYNRTQAPAITQSYTAGHIHSHPQAYVPTYTLNATPSPTKKPVQDQRLGFVRGQVERRGSFSTASAAAGVASSAAAGSMSHRDASVQSSSHHRNGSLHRPTNSVPAMVPTSALNSASSKGPISWGPSNNSLDSD